MQGGWVRLLESCAGLPLATGSKFTQPFMNTVALLWVFNIRATEPSTSVLLSRFAQVTRHPVIPKLVIVVKRVEIPKPALSVVRTKSRNKFHSTVDSYVNTILQ